MSRRLRVPSLVAVLALAAASCSGGPAPSKEESVPHGGTLRVGFPLGLIISFGPDTLDPQKNAAASSFELCRCCLARTLYAHDGHPTNLGGAILRPDLAEGMPKVSPDGLTWTVHIKRGVHYGPPLAAQTVRAADFIRAFERTGDPMVAAPFAFYLSVIQGSTSFKAAGPNPSRGSRRRTIRPLCFI